MVALISTLVDAAASLLGEPVGWSLVTTGPGQHSRCPTHRQRSWSVAVVARLAMAIGFVDAQTLSSPPLAAPTCICLGAAA